MFEFEGPDEPFTNTPHPGFYISPPETADYIQLRFQLARLNVYRIVQLPLTFTFANLHILIQYMFGWSDTHLHKAEVFPNVVLHDEEGLVGTIKSCGRKRPPEDYELSDYWAMDNWRRFEPEDKPIYRVEPGATHGKDKFDRVMTMEERGVVLKSIWSHNEIYNVSDRQCSNAQIGIIYTYDFGDEWTVHITCEEGSIFYRLDTPSNLPIFKDARGAPPAEHGAWDDMEDDPEDKTVSPRLFDVSYFQRYCENKVVSKSRKTKLDILTSEEAEDRHRKYLRRERKRQRREREREKRIANGEEDEDEDEDEDDDYDSCDSE